MVTAREQPKRLDVFLASHDAVLSRNVLQRLMEQGRVTVNGRSVKASQRIHPGDAIAWDSFVADKLVMEAEPLTLEILYEDEALLVIHKPPALVVHPSPGHWQGTLLNGLLAHMTERPGLVHRLDRDTSGVLVIAKNGDAHRRLAKQFVDHSIHRVYEALIAGVPTKRTGVIDAPIGRHRKGRNKFAVNGLDAKAAVTEYRVTQRFGSAASHVRLMPQTGRTHQLRVHLASFGHPILGDTAYGGPSGYPRVMLHARELGFLHPATGKKVIFERAAPEDFAEALRAVDTESPR